jgi:MYXO-CTERM domain-containing protein
MRRTLLLSLTLPAIGILGCQRTPLIIEESYPDLLVSVNGTDVIDFGELEFGEQATRTVLIENLGDLPLGLSSIALDGSGMPEHFAIEYDVANISCSGDANYGEIITTSGEDTAAPKGIGTDSADTGPGGKDTSASGDEDTGASDDDTSSAQILVLPGNCRLPVDISFSPSATGTLLGAMEVLSVTEKLTDGRTQAAYYADPYNYKEVTIFQGVGLKGQGNIFVQPRQIDFGSLWEGETQHAYVYLDNVGDGDLGIGEPALDKNCSSEFSIDLLDYDADYLLEPGVGSLFRVTYTPETTSGTQCSLYVYSEDPIEPEVEVTMVGNAGLDPDSSPPTVQIIAPSQGYIHTSGDNIQLKLQLNDLDQPANSLTCTVKASAQIEGTLGSCSPNNESGYTIFEVDTELLKDGPESLLVTVIDMDGLISTDSTSILWNSTGSDSDDDGDGFGDGPDDIASGLYDCDDNDPETYPGAAEFYDKIDNDCDNAIDEDTNGGDDDGDSVSELDGDCNDNSADSYPGAPELPDFEDNDCDGLVDEGTATYDGDGDGYSLATGDCNDADPDKSPAAVEYCNDGYDNDCDYQADYADLDGCVELDTRPLVVGGCIIGQRSLEQTLDTTVTMYIHDPDTPQEELSYSWTISPEGFGNISSPNSRLTAWAAPAGITDDAMTADGRKNFLVYGIVTDPSNGQSWCTDEIVVYTDEIVSSRETIANLDELQGSGCSDGENAILAVPLLGLFAFGARRRRRD